MDENGTHNSNMHKSQSLSDLDTEAKNSSNESEESSEDYTDLNQKFESSLNISKKPGSSSKETESCEIKECANKSEESSKDNIDLNQKFESSLHIRKKPGPSLNETESCELKECANESEESSKYHTDFNQKFETSLNLYQKPESNFKQAETSSYEECNFPKESVFRRNRRQSRRKKECQIYSRPISVEAIQRPSSPCSKEDDVSQINKECDINQSRIRPSIECQISEDLQANSDRIKDTSENNTDLNKRLESSLCTNVKSESNSTEAKPSEKDDIDETSSFPEGNRNSLSRRPSLLETVYRPYESNHNKGKKKKNKKTISCKSTSPSKGTDIQLEPLLHSGRGQTFEIKGSSNTDVQYYPTRYPLVYPQGCYPVQYFLGCHPQQYLQRIVAQQFSGGYYPNLNTVCITNPMTNQADAYTGQYPKGSLRYPRIGHIQKTNEIHYRPRTLNPKNIDRKQLLMPPCSMMQSPSRELPPSNFKTFAQPVLFPHSSKAYYNQMPPIRTNAAPLHYLPSSPSYTYNAIPHISTNAVIMPYIVSSSRYQNPELQIEKNAASSPYVTFSGATFPSVSKKDDLSSEGLDLIDLKREISGRISVAPMVQTSESTLKTSNNANSTTTNLQQSEKLTNHEEPTKTTFSSKKNTSNVGAPKNLSSLSYSLDSIFHHVENSKSIQKTPNQSPTPLVSSYFASNTANEREIISQEQNLGIGSESISNSYSNLQTSVKDSPSPCHDMRSNSNNLFGPIIGNWGQPETNESLAGGSIQNQPVQQNLSVMPQYRNSNQLGKQHGVQYQPSMQNFSEVPRYQDPKTPMEPLYQAQSATIGDYGLPIQTVSKFPYRISPLDEYQLIMQDAPAYSQYQDPNNTICENETHYKPSTDNSFSLPSFEIRNPHINQYEIHYQFPKQEPYFRNSNASINQHQPSVPNTTSVASYHEFIKHPIHEYGIQTHLETSWPTDVPWAYQVGSVGLPTQKENQNLMPLQIPASNPWSTSIDDCSTWSSANDNSNYPSTTDPGLISNVSTDSASVENIPSISMGYSYSYRSATK